MRRVMGSGPSLCPQAWRQQLLCCMETRLEALACPPPGWGEVFTPGPACEQLQGTAAPALPGLLGHFRKRDKKPRCTPMDKQPQ